MDADSLTQIRQIVTEAAQGLREEMGGLRTDLRQEMVSSSTLLREEMQNLRSELRQEIAATATTLREEMGGLRSELRQEMTATATTLREDIADTKRHTGILIEDLHHKLDLVIEGQQFHRQQLVDIHSEVHQESRDTRAMLQLSYHQLQERVENLERRLQTVEQHLGLST